MSAAAVFGSTGLVGSFILSQLLDSQTTFAPIHTIFRRAPKSTSANLNAHLDSDTSKWPSALASLDPAPSAVFSAVGTNRIQAGSLDAQWKIDHDLNVDLAKAAKEQGVSTFVFISSAGTRGLLARYWPYGKMKNGVEDSVRDLDFEHGIILKPGMIYGERENGRLIDGLIRPIFKGIGSLHKSLSDTVGHDADLIARAAIRAAELAREGKAPSKFWVIGGAEIVKLGAEKVDSST